MPKNGSRKQSGFSAGSYNQSEGIILRKFSKRQRDAERFLNADLTHLNYKNGSFCFQKKKHKGS